jgi:hypothetical protein
LGSRLRIDARRRVTASIDFVTAVTDFPISTRDFPTSCRERGISRTRSVTLFRESRVLSSSCVIVASGFRFVLDELRLLKGKSRFGSRERGSSSNQVGVLRSG